MINVLYLLRLKKKKIYMTTFFLIPIEIVSHNLQKLIWYYYLNDFLFFRLLHKVYFENHSKIKI